MIVLIGAHGSMGRRYAAILRHLDREFQPFDVGEDDAAIAAAADSDGVILATPTYVRYEHPSGAQVEITPLPSGDLLLSAVGVTDAEWAAVTISPAALRELAQKASDL